MKTAKNKYEYIKKWKLDNPEKMKEYKRKYHQKNKSRLSKYKKNWVIDNPEYNRDYMRECRKTDPKYRIDGNMSGAIRRCLYGKKVGRKWEVLVGYTLEDLIQHLENLFESWMNWNNYGKWDIDHIKPKSLFHYKTVEDPEFKKCWALKNLQPMEHIANLKKYNHFDKK